MLESQRPFYLSMNGHMRKVKIEGGVATNLPLPAPATPVSSEKIAAQKMLHFIEDLELQNYRKFNVIPQMPPKKSLLSNSPNKEKKHIQKSRYVLKPSRK